MGAGGSVQRKHYTPAQIAKAATRIIATLRGNQARLQLFRNLEERLLAVTKDAFATNTSFRLAEEIERATLLRIPLSRPAFQKAKRALLEIEDKSHALKQRVEERGETEAERYLRVLQEQQWRYQRSAESLAAGTIDPTRNQQGIYERPLQCDNGHRLRKFTVEIAGHFCRVCNDMGGVGFVMWGCGDTSCVFAICTTCYTEQATQTIDVHTAHGNLDGRSVPAAAVDYNRERSGQNAMNNRNSTSTSNNNNADNNNSTSSNTTNDDKGNTTTVAADTTLTGAVGQSAQEHEVEQKRDEPRQQQQEQQESRRQQQLQQELEEEEWEDLEQEGPDATQFLTCPHPGGHPLHRFEPSVLNPQPSSYPANVAVHCSVCRNIHKALQNDDAWIHCPDCRYNVCMTCAAAQWGAKAFELSPQTVGTGAFSVCFRASALASQVQEERTRTRLL